MIIVSDTTPLSELAKIGRLTLLRDVYGAVIIPQQVYDEVTTGIHPAATAVPLQNWIEVLSVSNEQKIFDIKANTKLGLGECAAFVLAEELGADLILVDDRGARREANKLNLPVIGTVGVLLIAKQRGLIFNVKEMLDALIANGMRINQRLYRQALAIAGE